jgi:hypothetical protein
VWKQLKEEEKQKMKEKCAAWIVCIVNNLQINNLEYTVCVT